MQVCLSLRFAGRAKQVAVWLYHTLQLLQSKMSANNLVRIFQENDFSRLVYVTAGYPTPELTPDILLAIQASGSVEAVELGVPFTDPVGDGPVIAECGKIAMDRGMLFCDICVGSCDSRCPCLALESETDHARKRDIKGQPPKQDISKYFLFSTCVAYLRYRPRTAIR